MIENGRLRLEKRQDIALIAEVLAVSADTLLGQPAPEIASGRPLVQPQAVPDGAARRGAR